MVISVLACSGPGALADIQRNIAIGYLNAAVGGIVALAIVLHAARSGRWRFTFPVVCSLLLCHPAWTVSAVHGDCGSSKKFWSYAFTAAFIVIAAGEFFPGKERRAAKKL